MGCVYNYKGILFNSELELDDFLLENKDLLKSHSDIVFSRDGRIIKNAQRRTKQILDEHFIPLETIRAEKQEQSQQSSAFNYHLTDDSNIGLYSKYIGVTEFLSKFKNGEKLLYPEFREPEYWAVRKRFWSSYDGSDANAFFTPEEIEDIFEGGEVHALISEDEVTAAINKIKGKWEKMAKIGTGIHRVMQDYFGETSGGTPVMNLNPYLQQEYFKSKIDSSLVPPEALGDAIARCEELKKYLFDTFGRDIIFMPELVVKAPTNQSRDGNTFDTLVGIIDLAVIDRDGNVHVIDYKTSPIPYKSNRSSEVKTRTYKYQLATYQRMLSKYGINMANSRLLVVPLELTEFHADDSGEYTFKGIKAIDKKVIADDLTSEIKLDKHILSNLDEFMPEPVITSMSTENLLQYVRGRVSNCFQGYNPAIEDLDERAADLVKDVKQDATTGKYRYRLPGMKQPIIAETKEDLINQLKKELKDQEVTNDQRVDSIIDTLKQAIQEGDLHPQFKINSKFTKDPQGDVEWFNKNLAQYCNGNWTVLDCEPAKELGIILLLNTNGLLDVVKISPYNLNKEFKFNKGTTIVGNAMDDITAQNMPKSTILKATQGNIELMETMFFLNNIKGLFEGQVSYIGQIKVTNPRMQEGNPTTDNSVILYNYKQLSKLFPDAEVKNNFLDGTIKMVTWVDRAYYTFKEIMAFIPEMSRSKAGIWSSFNSCKSDLDKNINDPEGLKTTLTELRDMLREKFPSLQALKPENYSGEPEQELYRMVTMALGELNGVVYHQLQDKNNDWLNKVNIFKGIQGLRLDNPGNTSSKFLNEATNFIYSAYQNIRADLNRYQGPINELTQKLKNSKGFGYLKERTIGNQVKLYENMFDPLYDDDLVLKNPWDTGNDLYLEEERNFLKYFLKTVNLNRYKADFVGLSDSQIEDKIQSNIKYLRVPLTFGGSDTIIALKGLMPAIKDKLSSLSPKNIVKRTQEAIDGFLSDEERDIVKSHEQIWEMQNRFDRGERDDTRLDDIKRIGIERFERNLETVLLKHLFAYSEKENINKILPSLESMAMYITQSGNDRNTKYEAESRYLIDYVKNKVFNQPIMDERSQKMHAYLSKAMSFTSKLALGLSPTQLYQHLNGLWIDISLIYTNPDGTHAFSVENMRDAYFFVAKDFVHYGNKRSLSEALNDFYGLNDRDMNLYVDRIKSGQYNFWNVDSFLFRFASRPDYYNRLTIFGARMRADGCWDAHSLDENGNLKYDWSKDTRYNLVAQYGLNYKSNDPEYIKQRQRYLAVAKQMVQEGTRNQDGTLFKVGDALPKAYSTQESSAYKDEIDWKYGFYSHESKSLMQSSLIGGLMLQMYTYWSGKKNQYFAESGIKQRGRMEQLQINGKLQWAEVDANGELTGEFTETNTGIPYMIWQGQFQEGIIITLRKTCEALWEGGLNEMNFKEGWDNCISQIWNNPDEKLRNTYRANLKQFQYDLTMFLILGELFGDMLVKASMEYQKKNKNKQFSDAVENTLLQLGPKMLRQSVMDFNFFDSFAGRLVSWNPFALSSMTQLVNNYSRAIFGEQRFYDAFVNTTTATRTLRPIFEFINPKEDE